MGRMGEGREEGEWEGPSGWPIRASIANHGTKGPGLHHVWAVSFLLIATVAMPCLHGMLQFWGKEKIVFLGLLLSEPAIFSQKKTPIVFLEAPPRRAWAYISSPPHPLPCHHMTISICPSYLQGKLTPWAFLTRSFCYTEGKWQEGWQEPLRSVPQRSPRY